MCTRDKSSLTLFNFGAGSTRHESATAAEMRRQAVPPPFRANHCGLPTAKSYGSYDPEPGRSKALSDAETPFFPHSFFNGSPWLSQKGEPRIAFAKHRGKGTL